MQEFMCVCVCVFSSGSFIVESHQGFTASINIFRVGEVFREHL